MIKNNLGKERKGLELRLFFRKTFNQEDDAKKLLNLYTEQEDFTPTHFGLYEPFKEISASNYQLALNAISNGSYSSPGPKGKWAIVFFERRKPLASSFMLEWSDLAHNNFSVSSYRVNERILSKQIKFAAWIDFCKRLVIEHEAWYASFAIKQEHLYNNLLASQTLTRFQHKTEPVTSVSAVGLDLEKAIPGFYWGNFFNKFYVDWIGRDKILSLSNLGYAIEFDTLGGVFLFSPSSPLDWDTSSSQQLRRRAKEKLGKKKFFDIAELRKKIEMIEPVSPTFLPEQLIVDYEVPDFPFLLRGHK